MSYSKHRREPSARSIPSSGLRRRLLKWLGGIVVAGVAAFLTASVTGLFQSIIPKPDNILRVVTHFFQKSARDDEFVIVISKLGGDSSNEFRELLSRQLNQTTSLPVWFDDQALDLDPKDGAEALSLVERRAAAVLRRLNADIYIYGHTVANGTGFELKFAHPLSKDADEDDTAIVDKTNIQEFINGDFFSTYLCFTADLRAAESQEHGTDEMIKMTKKLDALDRYGTFLKWYSMGRDASRSLQTRRADLLRRISEDNPKFSSIAIGELERIFDKFSIDPITGRHGHKVVDDLIAFSMIRGIYADILLDSAKRSGNLEQLRDALSVLMNLRTAPYDMTCDEKIADAFLLRYGLTRDESDRDNAIRYFRMSLIATARLWLGKKSSDEYIKTIVVGQPSFSKLKHLGVEPDPSEIIKIAR